MIRLSQPESDEIGNRVSNLMTECLGLLNLVYPPAGSAGYFMVRSLIWSPVVVLVFRSNRDCSVPAG
jgi:hypothetical protein